MIHPAMLPFRWQLGPFAVSPGEVFALLGAGLVALVARRRLAPLGIGGARLFDLVLAALIGGAIGARLFYFVPLLVRGSEGLGTLFSSWSEGSGYFGGLAGGSVAVAALARLRRQPVLQILDAGALPLPLGFAVGKVGCFLAGCCYGVRCPGPPGVAFASGSLAFREQRRAGLLPADAAASLPVHPTQLYELALGIVLFAALLLLIRRSRRPGETYLAYVLGYSAWRFAIEFLRDDPGRHGFGAGALSDSQVTALLFAAASALSWLALRRRSVTEAGSG